MQPNLDAKALLGKLVVETYGISPEPVRVHVRVNGVSVALLTIKEVKLANYQISLLEEKSHA